MTHANTQPSKKAPSSGRKKQMRQQRKKSKVYPPPSTKKTPNTPSENHDKPTAHTRRSSRIHTAKGVSSSAEYLSMNRLSLGLHATPPPQGVGGTVTVVRDVSHGTVKGRWI